MLQQKVRRERAHDLSPPRGTARVTESARVHSYISGEQVQKTSENMLILGVNNLTVNIRLLAMLSSLDIVHQYSWRIEGASHPSHNKKDVKHFYPENHIKSKAPPSTLMFCPFMKEARELAKNKTTLATSSFVAILPVGFGEKFETIVLSASSKVDPHPLSIAIFK